MSFPLSQFAISRTKKEKEGKKERQRCVVVGRGLFLWGKSAMNSFQTCIISCGEKAGKRQESKNV